VMVASTDSPGATSNFVADKLRTILADILLLPAEDAYQSLFVL
jgi:hypothetical protein